MVPSKRSSKLLVGAFALASLAALASAKPGSETTFWLRLKPGHDSLAKAKSLVSGLGTVLGKDDKRHAYTVRMADGLSVYRVFRHLRATGSVADIDADPHLIASLGPDRSSVGNLDLFVRSVRSLSPKTEEDEDRDDRKPMRLGQFKVEKEGGPRLDYLQAYQQYVRQRALPNDTINLQAYADAVVHRDAMPSGHIGPITRDIGSGASWQFVGPKNLNIPYNTYYGKPPISGRVNVIAVDPTNANNIFIGAATGGVFKSTDGGVTWTSLSDTWPTLPVGSLAIDPKNSQVIYAGGGDDHGSFGPYSNWLMKSTDGGATWTSLTLPYSSVIPIAEILIDPDNSNIVTIATGGAPSWWGGVYRSTNAGGSFTQVISSSNTMFRDLTCSIADSGGNRTYYASGGGVYSAYPCKIYKSADHGQTWSAVALPSTVVSTLGYAIPIAASKVDASTVYLLDPYAHQIFKSTNKGTSWTDITGNYPMGNEVGSNYNWSQYYYNYDLSVSSRTSGATTTDVVYCGNIDLSFSVNGGSTWRSIGGPSYVQDGVSAVLHNDQHSLAVNPQNPNQVWIGNDGGFYRMDYNATADTWAITNLNANLPITEFYTGAWHPTDATKMLGGAQDNAGPASLGDLANWQNVAGGDGAGVAIDPTNPLIQISSSQYDSTYRTTDGWSTASDITPPMQSGENVPFTGVVTLDPNNPALLYTGTNLLYRYNSATSTWTRGLGSLKSFSTSYSISAIAVAKGDTNRLYVGTEDGYVYTSADQGVTWTQINTGTVGLPATTVRQINVNPSNTKEILVAMAGTGTGHLWKCADVTAAARTWVNLSGTGGTALPDVPANAVARDPWSSSVLYVGTDVGVFMSNDAGLSWTNVTNPLGLPNVQVNALDANKTTGYLNAATFGRGMWRIPIVDPNAANVSTVTFGASSIKAGTTTTGTVTLTKAPAANTTVNLAATTGATVPATVTVAAGATSATFTVTGSMVATDTTSTITASLGSSSVSNSIKVTAFMAAQFVSQSVPTSAEAGRSFLVQVTMKNTGSIPWTRDTNFRLGSQNPQDNTNWGLTRIWLTAGETIQPGQSKTFQWNAVAPSTLGTYNFQWRMLQVAVAWFGDLSTNIPIQVVTPVNDAVFVSDANIPTQVGRGLPFTGSITMKNTGTATWTRATNYRLGSQNPQDNTNWGLTRIWLGTSDSIAPGATKTFTFTLNAPSTNGTYNFQWQMLQSGVQWFGQMSTNHSIQVIDPPIDSQFVSQTVPSTVTHGQTFNVTINMKNTGTATWTRALNIKLGSQNPQDNTNWGLTRIWLGTNDSIAPGATKAFTATLTAPSTPGTYHFQWRMVQEGYSWFGQSTQNIDIVVQ